MSTVVSLSGAPLPDPATPNQKVVEILEDLLEEARAGKICDVGVAYVTGIGSPGVHARYHGQTQFACLVCAAAMLQHDLLARQDVDLD